MSYGGLIAAAFAARHPGAHVGAGPRLGDSAVVAAGRARPLLLRAPTSAVAALLRRLTPAVSRDCRCEAGRSLSDLVAALDTACNVVTHIVLAAADGATRAAARGERSGGRTGSRSRAHARRHGRSRARRVVPVALTESTCACGRTHSRIASRARGHLGCVTRPDEFADIVAPIRGADIAAPAIDEESVVG